MNASSPKRASTISALACAVVLGAAALGSAAPGEAATAPPPLETEEFMVPSGDPGIELYVRNKHEKGIKAFAGEKTLLFVHGATFPAESTFDLSLGGVSMMEFLAQRGYDVYLVDVRGYGRSTRPPEMDQPADQNAPFARTDTAVKDVGAAVDFILKRRKIPKLNLMGFSWGTAIMGWYTAQNNEKVHKLVLYAPRWLASAPSAASSTPKLAAYRTVTMESAKERWLRGVAEDKKAALIPAGWFEAVAAATLASDPKGAEQTPPVIRVPNGIVQDNQEYWGAGKPLYDPALIRVPTFLVHADWDQDLPSSQLHAYFAKLTNAPYRRYVEIGEGTHFVFMEKNRMQLFREVLAFLDEPPPSP